ncbi:MAG TPA: aminodeoxychorismate synthase component I, partial [Kofleriaceae bacterium]|nr:aminodeoxychorismate synthase component I [Kofleriaceae bacterium]
AHRLGRLDAERVFGALFARDPRAFWLDSSLVEPGLSRFSFMGGSDGPLSAIIEYRADSGELTVRSRTGTQVLRESVFDHLERELRRLECAPPPVPFDFTCGYVGYFGYELKRECGGGAAHRAVTPDAHFLLADRVIAFDHAEGETHLVCLAPAGQPEVATAWFAEMEQRLGDLPEPMAAPPSIGGERLAFRLSRDPETYAADIARCLEEIGDGESYEVCLTNQLRARVRVPGLDLHRVLRRANPAPHAAFLRLGDTSVACSSPERFLRIDRAGWVEASPIKGTARRGATAGEDAGLREALRASVKDRAENLMIVDLVRNDLGQVCEIGSVQVPRLMDVESYATVHQMVSTIRGHLRPGLGAIACVRAAFPGGSMTGAPKIRTMEIIDRLEGEARGIYSGALGYLSLSGAADLNIVIRTAVVGPEEVSVGVGGAIVALSDPDAELQEVLLKGSALLRAIALVARGDEEHDIAGLDFRLQASGFRLQVPESPLRTTTLDPPAPEARSPKPEA